MLEIKSLGPKAAAEYMHMSDEGLNSNPYPKGTSEHDVFIAYMGDLQHRESEKDLREIWSGV